MSPLEMQFSPKSCVKKIFHSVIIIRKNESHSCEGIRYARGACNSRSPHNCVHLFEIALSDLLLNGLILVFSR